MSSTVMDNAVTPQRAEIWLEIVRQQVTTLQFGVVQITVHESKVVQVERTEKIRIAHSAPHRNLTPDQTTEG